MNKNLELYRRYRELQSMLGRGMYYSQVTSDQELQMDLDCLYFNKSPKEQRKYFRVMIREFLTMINDNYNKYFHA